MRKTHLLLNMATLPSLPALRAFEAAARLGSFQAAAEAINVSPTAISHHIRGLEAALNVQLFTRAARQVRLTNEGQKLADGRWHNESLSNSGDLGWLDRGAAQADKNPHRDAPQHRLPVAHA